MKNTLIIFSIFILASCGSMGGESENSAKQACLNRLVIEQAVDPIVTLEGQDVRFAYALTNTGNNPVKNFVVSGSECDVVNQSPNFGDNDNDGELDKGEIWIYLTTCQFPTFGTKTNVLKVSKPNCEKTDSLQFIIVGIG